MRGRFVIVLAVGVLMSVPLSAHHGGAAFDNGKKVTLKGTVTQWVYMNPHCLISLDVKGEDGKVVNWVIETQAPGIMYPAGYRKDSFKPGDEDYRRRRARQEWPAGRAHSDGRHREWMDPRRHSKHGHPPAREVGRLRDSSKWQSGS